jgi:hypothetical protein
MTGDLETQNHPGFGAFVAAFGVRREVGNLIKLYMTARFADRASTGHSALAPALRITCG